MLWPDKREKKIRFTIYLHRNRVTGKPYVGQTKKTMQRRWSDHVSDAKKNRGCRLLGAAIRKYGSDAFDHEVLDVVTSQSGADIAEAVWIKQRRALTPDGYNLDSGRYQGAERSFSHSEETKRLMSEKAKAREVRMTPEERSARRLGTSTQEDRNEVARNRWASYTPEKRADIAKRVSESLSASEKNTAAIRARWAKTTPEQRSDIARKVHEAQTPEQRSERQRKSWNSIPIDRRIEMIATLAAARRKPRGPNGRKIGCSRCGADVEVSSGSWCKNCRREYSRNCRHGT